MSLALEYRDEHDFGDPESGWLYLVPPLEESPVLPPVIPVSPAVYLYNAQQAVLRLEEDGNARKAELAVADQLTPDYFALTYVDELHQNVPLYEKETRNKEIQTYKDIMAAMLEKALS